MSRPASLRFVLRAALLMALFYVLIYFPYAPGSAAARALAWYVALQARLAGSVLAMFDSSVFVEGTVIRGRFPLEIVLDCTALDAICLFCAAVIAFPAPVRRRLQGLAGGVAAIAFLNLWRIVVLYFAGTYLPALFDLLHEDVLQIALVLAAAGGFVLFAWWAARGSTPRAETAAAAALPQT